MTQLAWSMPAPPRPARQPAAPVAGTCDECGEDYGPFPSCDEHAGLTFDRMVAAYYERRAREVNHGA